MTLSPCVVVSKVGVQTLPHMQTGIARLAVKAGAGRRDSNAIGVASRELRVRRF